MTISQSNDNQPNNSPRQRPSLMLGRETELVIALILLGFAASAALIWIPTDVETGVIHTHHRQTILGDAFFPTLAASLLGVAALVQLLMTLGRNRSDGIEETGIDMTTLSFLLPFSGIVALSLAVMYWAGPIAVDLFVPDVGETARTYRQMARNLPLQAIGIWSGRHRDGVSDHILHRRTVPRRTPSVVDPRSGGADGGL